MVNSLGDRLLNEEKVVGVIIGDYSPSIVKVFGYIGLDFVFIDDEHGVLRRPQSSGSTQSDSRTV